VRQLSLEREIETASHFGDVNSFTFSDDGDILAAGFLDGNVALWDFWGKKLFADFHSPSQRNIEQVPIFYNLF
jgi:WD40 repeat protein